MADKKISALPPASTPLAGTEVLPIVQGGITEQVSVANLTAGRNIGTAAITTTGNVGVKCTPLSITPLQVSLGTNRRLSTFLNGSDNVLGFLTDAGNWTSTFYTGTPAIFGNGASEAFRIDTNQNIVMKTAGKGIDFSANGGDVLSQYDEGTYTPVFTASSSNPTVTYGLQRGKYVRVGNTVTVSVFITWSALSGGSGDLQISLPFAGESSVGAGAAGAIADLTGFTFAAGRTFCSVRPNSNVLYATFPQSGSLVSTSNTTVAQTASSGLIVFSCTYLV